MPHSAGYKAVYIHIPKNAGTSIESWMNIDKTKFHRQVNGIEVDHMTAELYKSHWASVFQSYYKFTLVRNPFDRMVSEYLHKKRYRDRRFIDVTNLSFDEFIATLNERFNLMSYRKHAEVSHFLPQHNYTHSKTGQQLVDYIGKFEALDDEIKKIGAKLGIKKAFTKVDQFSSGERLSCGKYYSRQSMEIVARLYARDFELFGYSRTIRIQPINLVHVVNPYLHSDPGELGQQSRVMQTLSHAQSHARGGRDKVELVACYMNREYGELKSRLPDGFKRLFIDKTVNDHVDLGLSKTRPLPLLRDIFEACYNHTNRTTDLVVYSNMDINVTEDFYQRIFEIVRSGSSHFCLNRSTIGETSSPHDPPMGIGLDPVCDAGALKKLACDGSDHPGYDCFVMFRNAMPKLRLNRAILGYTPIGEFLKNQLAASHWSFKVFERENLTYHYGNDTPHYQRNITNLIYTLFNFQQAGMVPEFRSHFKRIMDLEVDAPNLEQVHANMCKLNLALTNGQNHMHCQGWNTIVDYLKKRLIHNDRGVHLIDFFDKDVNRPEVLDVCTRSDWIGFIHMAPGEAFPKATSTLRWLLTDLDNRGLSERVFPNCRGVFVLTDYLRDYLAKYFQQHNYKIPIEVYRHPKEIQAQFNLKDFLARRKRRILHVGRYMRNLESFTRLKVPNNYQKQVLNNSLNPRDYLNALSNSIVYVDFYDASASNLLVECIVANTPILVNRIGPVVEYLGPDYPLYFDSAPEAVDRLSDAYISLAHNYLKQLDKRPYRLSTFYAKWLKSPILTRLANDTFPTQSNLMRMLAPKPRVEPYARNIANSPVGNMLIRARAIRRAGPVMPPAGLYMVNSAVAERVFGQAINSGVSVARTLMRTMLGVNPRRLANNLRSRPGMRRSNALVVKSRAPLVDQDRESDRDSVRGGRETSRSSVAKALIGIVGGTAVVVMPRIVPKSKRLHTARHIKPKARLLTYGN